jgi:hypothetical protein
MNVFMFYVGLNEVRAETINILKHASKVKVICENNPNSKVNPNQRRSKKKCMCMG